MVTKGQKNPKYGRCVESISISFCVAAGQQYHAVTPRCVAADDRLACVVYRRSWTCWPAQFGWFKRLWITLLFYLTVSIWALLLTCRRCFWSLTWFPISPHVALGFGHFQRNVFFSQCFKGPFWSFLPLCLFTSWLYYCEKAQVYFWPESCKTNIYWYIRYWRQCWCWDLISDVPTSAHFLPMSAMIWWETPPLCSGLLVDLLNVCKLNHNDSYFWWLILWICLFFLDYALDKLSPQVQISK